MTHNTETLIDEGGVEVLVDYAYESASDFLEEPGNPGTLVKGCTYTELNSVEVVIKGRGIDILPLLHEEQKEWIINQLQYEE